MKRKSPIIQQGVVTELMSQLASLPEREKAPDDPVSLSEMFRTKEYVTEVKAALKKGYTFDDLAEIFSEKCGVAVSARQIRYHFTRGKNRGMKNKPDKKAGEAGTSENHTTPADSERKGADNDGTETNGVTNSSEDCYSEDTRFIPGNDAASGRNPGAFAIE
jgi:hypothetical protein